MVRASENFTVCRLVRWLCSRTYGEQRNAETGLRFARGAACVATEGCFAFSTHDLYGENGDNLDSLLGTGRGARSACRAWAFAPGGRGRATGDRGSASWPTDCPK